MSYKIGYKNNKTYIKVMASSKNSYHNYIVTRYQMTVLTKFVAKYKLQIYGSGIKLQKKQSIISELLQKKNQKLVFTN